jgi:hypothetical protein
MASPTSKSSALRPRLIYPVIPVLVWLFLSDRRLYHRHLRGRPATDVPGHLSTAHQPDLGGSPVMALSVAAAMSKCA